jgi:hypothetical protein
MAVGWDRWHAAGMERRPLSLLGATVLTATVALGALLFGAFFVAIAAGAIGFFVRVGFGGLAGAIGVASLAYGLTAVLAAGGLWLRRAWAWPLAALIHLVALLGILVAASEGGFGAHIGAGLALAIGGIGSLTSPSVRETLAA